MNLRRVGPPVAAEIGRGPRELRPELWRARTLLLRLLHPLIQGGLCPWLGLRGLRTAGARLRKLRR